MSVVGGKTVEKMWDELSGAKSKKAQYDRMTKNIITCTLNLDHIFRDSQCASTKEM